MFSSDQNAMTEVALALAMAFFAIFVLAAVSMSQPASHAVADPLQPEPVEANQAIKTSDVVLAAKDGERTLESSESFYAFYQGRYFDQTLNETPLSQVQSASATGNVVLAVNPKLPMQKVLAMKQEKNLPNLSISILDEAWISRLEAM